VVTSIPGGLGDGSETLTLRRVVVSELDQTNPLDKDRPAGIDFEGPHARLLLEDLKLSGATGPELLFAGALTNSTLRRVEVDSVDPGWLGAFSGAAAPGCSTALEGHWLTRLDATLAGDCSFATGPGGTSTRCGCSGGAWTPITSKALPGIEFADGVTHANVTLERISVKNARGVTGMLVRGALSGFSVRTIRGADDSLATDLDQRSAAEFDAARGFRVTGASCAGTQRGVPCIERRPGTP
jgi:hypothetical protein